jgi:hypothetical protein
MAFSNCMKDKLKASDKLSEDHVFPGPFNPALLKKKKPARIYDRICFPRK